MLRSSSLFRAREQVSLGMSRIVSEDVNTIYVCFVVMTSYFHIPVTPKHHTYNSKWLGVVCCSSYNFFISLLDRCMWLENLQVSSHSQTQMYMHRIHVAIWTFIISWLFFIIISHYMRSRVTRNATMYLSIKVLLKPGLCTTPYPHHKLITCLI